MEVQDKSPHFFAWDDQRPFVVKICGPALLLLIGGLTCLSATRLAGIILGSLIVLVGLVYAYSVGLVKAEPHHLYYRRFLKWRCFEYEEIVACKRSFLIPLFYLKPRHFEPPFGKLYFVNYSPVARIWQQSKYDRETIEFIRARVGGRVATTDSLPHGGPEKTGDSLRRNAFLCIESFLTAAGLILFFRLVLDWPGTNFPPQVQPGHWFYQFNVDIWILCARLLDWSYFAIASVFLVITILLLRFRRWAASLAMVLGALTGGVVARLFDSLH